jgi:hypothetical protein
MDHRRDRLHRDDRWAQQLLDRVLLYSIGTFFLIGPYSCVLFFVGESFDDAHPRARGGVRGGRRPHRGDPIQRSCRDGAEQ